MREYFSPGLRSNSSSRAPCRMKQTIATYPNDVDTLCEYACFLASVNRDFKVGSSVHCFFWGPATQCTYFLSIWFLSYIYMYMYLPHVLTNIPSPLSSRPSSPQISPQHHSPQRARQKCTRGQSRPTRRVHGGWLCSSGRICTPSRLRERRHSRSRRDGSTYWRLCRLTRAVWLLKQTSSMPSSSSVYKVCWPEHAFGLDFFLSSFIIMARLRFVANRLSSL